MKKILLFALLLSGVNFLGQNNFNKYFQFGTAYDMVQVADNDVYALGYYTINEINSQGDIVNYFPICRIEKINNCEENEIIYSEYEYDETFPFNEFAYFDMEISWEVIKRDILVADENNNFHFVLSDISWSGLNYSIFKGVSLTGELIYEFSLESNHLVNDIELIENEIYFVGYQLLAGGKMPFVKKFNLSNPSGIIDIQSFNEIDGEATAIEKLPNNDYILQVLNHENNQLIIYKFDGDSFINYELNQLNTSNYIPDLQATNTGMIYSISNVGNTLNVKGIFNSNEEWTLSIDSTSYTISYVKSNGNLLLLSYIELDTVIDPYWKEYVYRLIEVNQDGDKISDEFYSEYGQNYEGLLPKSIAALNDDQTVVLNYHRTDGPTDFVKLFSFNNSDGISGFNYDVYNQNFEELSNSFPNTKTIKPCQPQTLISVNYGGVCPYENTVWLGDVQVLDDPYSPTPTFQTCQPGTYNFTYVVEDGAGKIAKTKLKVIVPLPDDAIFIQGWGE